jgi:hypothetical protein
MKSLPVRLAGIEMDNPTKNKHIGSGLNPSLCVKLPRNKNGFNHLSLKHNLPHGHRVVLRIN